jgi:hypothetical protein
MLWLLLTAQVASTSPSTDSTYASSGLRDIVARAAVENRRPPAAFKSYTSRIETELSLLIRDTLGREHTAEVEQLATAASWDRNGRYDLHIIGYRAQSIGVPYSTLSIVRGWTVPSLYGNRLSLGAYFAQARRQTDTLRAVHPFATDRDNYYRFTGGDTITTLRVGARSIPLVRVRAHPSFAGPTNLAAFDGEIDLDADRAQIVRMRGRFVTIGGRSPNRVASVLQATTGAVAVAYAEFVNAEIDGKYWLPAFQRTEFQASFQLLGQSRPIFRLVSNIQNIVVNDTAVRAADDTSFRPRVVVTWAAQDSVDAFRDWQRGLGTQSGSVHSDDFQDLAPDVWRLVGAPRWNLFPTNTRRMFRFNRVEGVFTGVAPSIDFRSLLPGATAGADIGWAWSEKTLRGGVHATYRRSNTITSVRAERTLAHTNDFALPLSEGPGFAALLGSIDEYDYVDRYNATLSITRVLGAVDVGLLTVQLGAGEDRSERARLAHGLFGRSLTFPPNRGSTNGQYALAAAELELNPNVTGDFIQPGTGLRARFESARGDLAWQRAEVALSSRRYLGPLSIALHADGGMLFGSTLPPQRLFELGGTASLPGYDYKEFVGDRAVLFRSFVSYRFNIWKRPLRLVRNVFIPGLSPGLAMSAQGGWTELSSDAARTSARLLGVIDGVPVSTPTERIRATVGGGLTFFSDLFHVGFARPLDQPAPWKFVIGFGSAF